MLIQRAKKTKNSSIKTNLCHTNAKLANYQKLFSNELKYLEISDRVF